MARLILGLRDPDPPAEFLDAIAEGRLAGILWFRGALGRTVTDAAERVGRLRDAWPEGDPPIFAADEEGGLIEQLSGLEEDGRGIWPRLASPRALGRAGSEGKARAHGREIGRRMRRIGLDVALAPVVDLDPGLESGVLGTRCFGAEPERVARLALAWLEGLASAGVRGCLKHYPGHGATAIDTHHDLPRIPAGDDDRPHIRPFAAIAESWRADLGPPPGVMAGHILREPSGVPATLDPVALGRIPRRLGPIWTDAIEMGALARFGDLETRARAATDAGADFVIVGADTEAGLALARSWTAPRSSRATRWLSGAPRPQEPRDPWPQGERFEVAAAALRLLSEGPLPPGAWDWILPDRFGAYGAVADPGGAGGRGRRSIVRMLRYENGDSASLARALNAAGSDRPALVGWIHRGPPDSATSDLLRAAGARARAIAHLLDAPASPILPGVWTADTCGFGEIEIAALHRRWETADLNDGSAGFAD